VNLSVKNIRQWNWGCATSNWVNWAGFKTTSKFFFQPGGFWVFWGVKPGFLKKAQYGRFGVFVGLKLLERALLHIVDVIQIFKNLQIKA